MNRKLRSLCLLISAVFIFMVLPVYAIDIEEAEANQLSLIMDFMGRSNAANDDETQGIGWERVNVSWSSLEVREGTIEAAALSAVKDEVMKHINLGKKVLLMLENPPVWAINRGEYTFSDDDINYTVKRYKGIIHGNMIRNLVSDDESGKRIDEIEISANNAAFMLSDNGIEAWKKFVSLIADTFSSSPYNITHYQIYNSSYGNIESFCGSGEQFINTIQKPAAEILHSKGLKHVSAGMHAWYSLDSYISDLDAANAWDLIDVFNLYYAPISSVDYLYNAAVERGKKNPAIWQTEVGFKDAETFVPNFYMRAFYWAVQRGLTSNRDQFKVFWSEQLSDGNLLLLSDYGVITALGRSLRTIAEALDGEKVVMFNGVQNNYDIPFEFFVNRSSQEAFLIDDRKVVVATHMLSQNDAGIFNDATGDTMHLDFFVSLLEMTIHGITGNIKPKRVAFNGAAYDLRFIQDENSAWMQVPVPDTLGAPPGSDREMFAEAQFMQRRDKTMNFFLVVESDNLIQNADTPNPPKPKNYYVEYSRPQ